MNSNENSILLVSRGLGIGGAQKILIFVANSLVSRGYNVSIVSISPVESTLQIDKRITITYLQHRWTDFESLSFLKRRLKVLSIFLDLRKAIKQLKPSLIISFIADINHLTLLAKSGYRIPLIASERDNPYIFDYLQKRTANRTYLKCDLVVFQTKQAMLAFNNNIRKKSVVIPNPCIPRLKKLPVFIGQRKKIFVAAGRLEEVKQFDILIKAFEQLHHKHPDYSLEIFGDGRLMDSLKRLIYSIHMDKCVVLKGTVNDVFAHTYDYTAFVLSSKSEGIPNVLIEAMAIGLPCISTDCEPGGPRELLDDGKRGLLVPVGDIDALARAMSFYIENPIEADYYATEGLKVKEEYSDKIISELWENAVKRVFDKRR